MTFQPNPNLKFTGDLKMIDGLWTVEFTSTINRSGRGVLVFINGRILGGDEGYYYSGTYEVADPRVQGHINVVRFDPNTMSVFGDIDQFSVSFSGDINESDFIAAATIVDKPKSKISIIGKKKEDLQL
jgi:T3SS negative regulator,GrlR